MTAWHCSSGQGVGTAAIHPSRGGPGPGPFGRGEQEGVQQVLALSEAELLLEFVSFSYLSPARILPGVNDLHIPLLWPEEERRRHALDRVAQGGSRGPTW